MWLKGIAHENVQDAEIMMKKETASKEMFPLQR